MDDFLKKIKAQVSDKEAMEHVKKIGEKIKKFGHTISGTVDGKGSLERPFAHTFGASFALGFELICFFPVKDKGLKIVGTIFNKIIELAKSKEIDIKNQIINDERIYELPLAMLVLDEELQKDIEKVWAKQLERDSLCSKFSTNDHQLILIIASDKDGILPWEENCSSYWPQMCPPPIVAIAQEEITGNDSLLSKLEKDYKIN